MLYHGIGVFVWASGEERFVATSRTLQEEKEEVKMEWDSSGHVACWSSDRKSLALLRKDFGPERKIWDIR